MDFFCLILVNITLFLREEIFLRVGFVPIFQISVAACLLCALPGVAEQFLPHSLRTNPITACLLGFWLMMCLVHVAQPEIMLQHAADFAKPVVYYLLVVAVLNTPVRLRRFLVWLGLLSAGLILMPVLRYHNLVANISPSELAAAALDAKTKKVLESSGQAFVEETDSSANGSETVIRRLSSGIFNDPNELCLVIVSGMLLSLYWLGERRLGAVRWFWLVPLLFLAHALALTYSRGGFISLLVGCGVLCLARFGWRKSLILLAFLMPFLFVAFAGRMTSLSPGEETGQSRIHLWSDALLYLREDPIAGVGVNGFGERSREEVHNTFLHSFAELGFFGGMLFLGTFYCALTSLAKLLRVRAALPDPDMRRLVPFLLAMTASYAAGIFTLSRAYEVPTYTILGLASAFVRCARVPPALAPTPFGVALLGRLAGLSIVFLAAIYIMVRLFMRV